MGEARILLRDTADLAAIAPAEVERKLTVLEMLWNDGFVRKTVIILFLAAAWEVYGWAAWSPAQGILTLRNPSDKPQSFSIDVAKAFELPSGAPQRYRMHSPFDEAVAPVELRAGEAHTFELKPFEVLTLESDPVSSVR